MQCLQPAAKTAATVNLTIAAGAYEYIYMHTADYSHLLRAAGPLQVCPDGPVLCDLLVEQGIFTRTGKCKMITVAEQAIT